MLLIKAAEFVKRTMPEPVRRRLMRWGFNLFPAFRRTGGRITFIAGDWREVRLKLPLSWRTMNGVGTLYGGSMYGAVDPVYMVMLIRILGPDYIVWDKAASITYKKPGKDTLYAHFYLSEDEISAIRTALITEPSVERLYRINLVDRNGVVHAVVEKTMYIRKKEATPATA
jgi:hypothetical protein